MERDSKIYVAGHRGMMGSAIVRELQRQGYPNIVTRTHRDLDLINQHFADIDDADKTVFKDSLETIFHNQIRSKSGAKRSSIFSFSHSIDQSTPYRSFGTAVSVVWYHRCRWCSKRRFFCPSAFLFLTVLNNQCHIGRLVPPCRSFGTTIAVVGIVHIGDWYQLFSSGSVCSSACRA